MIWALRDFAQARIGLQRSVFTLVVYPGGCRDAPTKRRHAAMASGEDDYDHERQWMYAL
jgi:hypothetical protein